MLFYDARNTRRDSLTARQVIAYCTRKAVENATERTERNCVAHWRLPLSRADFRVNTTAYAPREKQDHLPVVTMSFPKYFNVFQYIFF